ncbi:MAG: 50S ribosomal protein L21 [Candidatus Cloacimonetes bacterium]|nr:50S ribosomal protein L21 [Candidatus Cloacimonadota bacterium]
MYAIIDFKGTQFKVEKDQTLKVPYLKESDVGSEIEIDKILMIKDEENTIIGKPAIDKAKVLAEIISHKKDKKIIVFKKKRRKGYEKKQGHRQNFTEIKIKEIIN